MAAASSRWLRCARCASNFFRDARRFCSRSTDIASRRSACAPDNCDYVAGEQVCHNQTIDITVDSPEEVSSQKLAEE